MSGSVRVQASSGSYDVRVGGGLLRYLGDRVEHLSPSAARVHFVIDTGVPGDIVESAIDSVARTKRAVSRSHITPTESVKIVRTWQDILEDAARQPLDRADVIVAIGGGIVGDIAGFAAASYRRGLTVLQCPTTLLAMVDASVGGKTGVNLDSDSGLLKNAVGAFHQPAEVIADISALASLTDRVLRAGLAECIKHAMLSADFGDPDLGAWMDQSREAILARDADALTELVLRNVSVKAKVVETDERESATGDMGRALLNLGHTFAHAIETHPGVRTSVSDSDSPIMHGEAVALGLVCASALSDRLGKTTDFTPAVRARLEAFGLPSHAQHLDDTEAILQRMHHDKKAMAGSIRFIVPVSKGRARVIKSPDMQVIREALNTIRSAS